METVTLQRWQDPRMKADSELVFGLAWLAILQKCICFSLICLSFFSMIYGTFISPEAKGSEMSEVSLGSAGVMNY